jgi:TPR repeat protein
MLVKPLVLSICTVVIVIAAGAIYTHWQLAPDATTAMRRGQYNRAAEYLLTESEQGSVRSQTLLGNLYYTGLGIRRDYAKAMHWYHLAAMQGDVSAQYNIGLMHLQGFGIQPDPISAAAWFLLAKDNGSARAETHLRRIAGSLNPNKVAKASRLFEQLARDVRRASVVQ